LLKHIALVTFVSGNLAKRPNIDPKKLLSADGRQMFLGGSFLHLFYAAEKIENAGHLERVPDLHPALFVFDNPRTPQNRQMLGDSGNIGTDHLGQFTNTATLARQLIDYEEPGRVGHRFDDPCFGCETGFGGGVHGQIWLCSLFFGNIAK
jgi:hypothetical protein